MVKSAILAAAFTLAFAAPAACAGTAYLSHTGSGTACSQAMPCANMLTAVQAAGDGGEVICLDKGNYGGILSGTLHQSFTISCGAGLWEAPSVTVSISTPAGADVVIEGLVIDELAFAVVPIIFDGQGSLHLHNVRIGNAISSAGTANGVIFSPSGPATLDVSDSIFYNLRGAGIQVRPTGSGSANVHIRNVKSERNIHGLFVDGSGSSVGINVNVTDSLFTGNSGNGIGAYSAAGGAGVTVSVKDSHITGNLGNGVATLAAAGAGAGSASIAIGGSLITGNVRGVSASSAGLIYTYGNNQIGFNGNNGTFTGSIGLQ